jgi:hypothetical protein
LAFLFILTGFTTNIRSAAQEFKQADSDGSRYSFGQTDTLAKITKPLLTSGFKLWLNQNL